jgi:hypothetical protein
VHERIAFDLTALLVEALALVGLLQRRRPLPAQRNERAIVSDPVAELD